MADSITFCDFLEDKDHFPWKVNGIPDDYANVEHTRVVMKIVSENGTKGDPELHIVSSLLENSIGEKMFVDKLIFNLIKGRVAVSRGSDLRIMRAGFYSDMHHAALLADSPLQFLSGAFLSRQLSQVDVVQDCQEFGHIQVFGGKPIQSEIPKTLLHVFGVINHASSTKSVEIRTVLNEIMSDGTIDTDCRLPTAAGTCVCMTAGLLDEMYSIDNPNKLPVFHPYIIA